jgi:hypothetical protein
MPQIVNSYKAQSSGLGDVFGELADALWGPKASAAEVNRQKATGMRRDNSAYEVLQRKALGGPIDFNDPETRAAVYGLDNARNTFEAHRGVATNTYGAMDPRSANAFVGAGGAYSSTGPAFAASQALEERKARMGFDRAAAVEQWKANNTPINVYDPAAPGGARIVSRAEAIGKGMTPVLSASDVQGVLRMQGQPSGYSGWNPSQLTAAGAQPSSQTPRMWAAPGAAPEVTYDGLTNARTGQPLTPGGSLVQTQANPEQLGLRPGVQANIQTQNVAMDRLRSVGQYAQTLMKPQNVGIPGMVKGAAQDLTQAATGLAAGLGFTGPQDALRDIQTRASQKGMAPEAMASLFQFDPALPQLGTAYYAMVMTGADALAGGMGKASDRDIALVKGMLGDPNSLFASSEQLAAKWQAVTDIADRLQGVNAAAMGGRPTPAPAAAPAAPQAAPAPAQQPTVERWIRGPDGRPMRAQ